MSLSHTSTSRDIGILSVVVQNAYNLNLPNQLRTEERGLYCTLYFNGHDRRTEAVKNGQWNHIARFTLFEEFEEEKPVASTTSPSSQNEQGTWKVKGGLVVLLSCWAENQDGPDFIGEASVDFTEALRAGATHNRVTLMNLTGRSCGEVYIQLTFRSHENTAFIYQPNEALYNPAPDYQPVDHPLPQPKYQLYDPPFPEAPATPPIVSDSPPLSNVSLTDQPRVNEKEAVFSAPPPVYETPADGDHDVRVDRVGEELAPDSSVWSAYLSTAATHDRELVDGWNKSLDVLLIFSSLFSAVVTAFAIESSKLLQPDYNQVNALLTAHLLSAMNGQNASYLSRIPSPAVILAFEKPEWAKVVNIFWFSALGFSLGSVLVAMLAKQWLFAYASLQEDEPHKSACDRQWRFDNLQQWWLPHILIILPALLHTSLFLFLLGLIIHTWQLDSTVSEVMSVILGILFVFYFASGTLAVFNPSCPYITPLSQFVRTRMPGANNPARTSSDPCVSRAVMWLATARDPTTVDCALQSLAGLRRGFAGYQVEQAEFLAKLAFERLRGCFIAESRRGDFYSLRKRQQYDASCYARTLMHFVDDSRAHYRAFATILNDPSLPTFMKLISNCSDPSTALLALCDYQRLLHRIEMSRWLSVHEIQRYHDAQHSAHFVHRKPATENVAKILKSLNDYNQCHIFLHPFAIEIAVETIGYAPLSWVAAISMREPLEEILVPLLHLLQACRDSSGGVRRAIARTLTILSAIHEFTRVPDPVDDFAMRYEVALTQPLLVDMSGNGEESDATVREMLLVGMSHFVASYAEEGEVYIVDLICDELYYECDRRSGNEDFLFSDKVAISALLPLLLVPSLAHEQKGNILTRLYANAVSAASGYNIPSDSFQYHITPEDPFPPCAVPTLVKTLDAFKDDNFPWMRDTAMLLYLITREVAHRRQLLAEASVMIGLIRVTPSEQIANYLFCILTHLAVSLPDLDVMLMLASAGILDLLPIHCDRYGLTPADIHAWVDVIPLLPVMSSEPLRCRNMLDSLQTIFEAQDAEKVQCVLNLREPLYQISGQPAPEYTRESASRALQRLRDSHAMGMLKGRPRRAHFAISTFLKHY